MSARGSELVVGGLLISSFVGYAIVALAILLLLRPLLRRIGFERVFANPPLAEAALFVCLLGLVVIVAGGFS